MEESTQNKKIYELGYHVLPNLSEDELAKAVEGIKSTLSDAKAVVIADQFPTMMSLAYPILKDIDNKTHKYDNAYFGWIKFEMLPESIDEFKIAVEKNPNILRFILIKTVRESTLATMKIAHKGMKRQNNEPETSAPMDEVAVDKKIDEMIDNESADGDLS